METAAHSGDVVGLRGVSGGVVVCQADAFAGEPGEIGRNNKLGKHENETFGWLIGTVSNGLAIVGVLKEDLNIVLKLVPLEAARGGKGQAFVQGTNLALAWHLDSYIEVRDQNDSLDSHFNCREHRNIEIDAIVHVDDTELPRAKKQPRFWGETQAEGTYSHHHQAVKR